MHRRSSFTLIELLVVIAIIAILAAILFPVFAQARDKARAASCLSNVKQLALSFTMYAQDYDETLPFWAPQCHSIGASAVTCGRVVTANLAATAADGAPYLAPGYFGSLWTYGLQPYIKNAQILGCPSDGQKWTVRGRVGTETGVGWINYNLPSAAVLPAEINNATLSYGASVMLTRYLKYTTYAAIDRPAEALIVSDATQAQLGVAGFSGTLSSPGQQGWLEAELAGAPVNDPRRNTMMNVAAFPMPNPRTCLINAGVGSVPSNADFPNIGIPNTAANIQRGIESCTRHQQGSNIGFVDGHAKYMKSTQLTGRYHGLDR
ncbi:prepilin-type N-terminal cleavage/methylation domain-containing protein [Armatimonas sp.]|uniref:prepilin-type N-terminal cleavage/methylation domain-containing protein n=1 Tax=Armatimonas sp. TaxID=1872638 RepID=UPI00286BA907|nr:prepilin-type N-terminal cleavage/methylation domain-containing protein [Armatimonas sp.]